MPTLHELSSGLDMTRIAKVDLPVDREPACLVPGQLLQAVITNERSAADLHDPDVAGFGLSPVIRTAVATRTVMGSM